MNMEEMEAVEIAYLRRTGPYGPENRQLMERLKAFLKERAGWSPGPSCWGSPWTIPAELRRTGAGMMWASSSERGSGSHWTPAGVRGGRYAVFEIPHTEREVSRFWEDLERLTAGCRWTAPAPFWSATLPKRWPCTGVSSASL